LKSASPGGSVIGQDKWCPLICSFPAWVTVWIAERFIERSIRCFGKLGCEAHPIVLALVCTTFDIGSRQTP